MATQPNQNNQEDIISSSQPSGNVIDINGIDPSYSKSNSNNGSNTQSMPKIEEVKPKKKQFDFIKKKKSTEAAQPIDSLMPNSNSNSNLSPKEQTKQLQEEEIIITKPSFLSNLEETVNSNKDNSEITNTNSSNSNSNSNDINENTSSKLQEKKKLFSFIKKQPSSSISPKPNQSSVAQMTIKDSPLNQKLATKEKIERDVSLIIDSPYKNYKKEADQNSLICYKQIKEFKKFFNQLNQIKQEIKAQSDIKIKQEESIVNLTEKQNSLIENNNFEEAIQVEEEIKAITEKIKETANVIQLKTETHLHDIKTQMTDLLKERINQFFVYANNLNQIQTESTEAINVLNETEKKAIEELSHSIEIQTKETEDLNIEYQESLQQIERTEGTYEKLFQEETKELTETINGLNDQHDNLKGEIEDLKKLLAEKEELLQSIGKQIDEHTNEKKAIKTKYITEESFVKLIKSKDAKHDTYNEAVKKLSELQLKHSSMSDHYNSKLKEIGDIIDYINNLRTSDIPKNKHMAEIIEIMKDINQKESDKRKQIHLNERAVEEYLIKINENNEKNEVLELQNKRISNDIVSLETNIKNLDEVKKAHVAKKQFKDAQAITLEIKKYNEKKKPLDDLLKENDKEMNFFKGENEVQINQVETLKNLIKEISAEINENSNKYATLYVSILKEIEEELFKLNDEDIFIIRNEIDAINDSLLRASDTKDNEKKAIEEEIETNEDKGDKGDIIEDDAKAKDNDINDVNDNKENKNDQIADQTNDSTEKQTIEINAFIKEPEISVEELNKQIDELNTKLAQAIEIENFEEADEINKKIEELTNIIESSTTR